MGIFDEFIKKTKKAVEDAAEFTSDSLKEYTGKDTDEIFKDLMDKGSEIGKTVGDTVTKPLGYGGIDEALNDVREKLGMPVEYTIELGNLPEKYEGKIDAFDSQTFYAGTVKDLQSQVDSYAKEKGYNGAVAVPIIDVDKKDEKGRLIVDVEFYELPNDE